MKAGRGCLKAILIVGVFVIGTVIMHIIRLSQVGIVGGGVNMLVILAVLAAIVAIWRYNPNKKDKNSQDDHYLDKRDEHHLDKS